MRIFALLFVCFMVALMSGLALFWSITSSAQGLWLDCLFLMALILALLITLSIVKRTASDSMMKISVDDELRSRDKQDHSDS